MIYRGVRELAHKQIRFTNRHHIPTSVSGDGNCLYRVISYHMYDDEKYYNIIMQKMLNWVRNDENKEFIKNHFQFNEINIESLEKNECYAGDFEIELASFVFQKNIFLWSSEDLPRTYDLVGDVRIPKDINEILELGLMNIKYHAIPLKKSEIDSYEGIKLLGDEWHIVYHGRHYWPAKKKTESGNQRNVKNDTLSSQKNTHQSQLQKGSGSDALLTQLLKDIDQDKKYLSRHDIDKQLELIEQLLNQLPKKEDKEREQIESDGELALQIQNEQEQIESDARLARKIQYEGS